MESLNARYDYNLFKVFFTVIDERPAMVLGGENRGQKNAFVVPLDSAWKYATDSYLWQQAQAACELLGLGTHKKTVFRVCDIILNHLEELVRMPPGKTDNQEEVAEQMDRDQIKIIANGV